MKQTFSEMVQDELASKYDVAVAIEDIAKYIACVNENVDHPYTDETVSRFDAMDVADMYYAENLYCPKF